MQNRASLEAGPIRLALRLGRRTFSLQLAQDLFVGIYLACLAGMAANLLSGGLGAESGGAGGAYLVVWAILYALSLPFAGLLIVRGWTARQVLLAILALYIVLSTFWAQQTSKSIPYALSLTNNVLFVIALRNFYTLDAFLAILRKTLTTMIAVGLLLALLRVPSSLYSDALSRSSILGLPPVQGLFSHKIYAGFYADLALVLNLATPRSRGRLLWCGVCLTMVLASGSSVALAMLAVALTSYYAIPIVLHRRRWPVYLAILGLLAVGFILIVPQFLDSVLTGLGRDITLTGRTVLWDIAFRFIGEKPVTGWAYSGIFYDSPYAPGNAVMANRYYAAPHFHNGYLQITAELGLLGLALFAAIIFSALRKSLREAIVVRTFSARAALCLLFLFLTACTVMNLGLRYNELAGQVLLAIFVLPFAAVARPEDSSA